MVRQRKIAKSPVGRPQLRVLHSAQPQPAAPVWLDLANETLKRGHTSLALTPKAFAVLRYLHEHPQRLITKQELFDAVWTDTSVTDGVLKNCISEIRQVLQDSTSTPRYIETVHRRGYRFIAPLTTSTQESGIKDQGAGSSSQPTLDPQPPIPTLVGRETELTQLHSWLERALRGERQLVFVTGEPGIGKTALAETFLHQITQQTAVQMGRGQCIAHFGPGEAYLPLLEALERLGRGAHGDRLLTSLRHCAPTWLAHLPTLVSDAERVTLQQQKGGVTQARLLRELATALEEMTVEHPLVLWLEDLHWSDTATIEFLAALARRQEAARLLVIGTYRPMEMLHDSHPFKGMVHELYGHELCQELRVEPLTEADVAHYIALRFAAPHWASRFAQVLHQRSGGNPLFLIQIVNELVARRIVTQTNEHWSIQGEPETIETSLPETIRHLVAQQRERLCPEEQRVLEAASVAGQEFSTAAVAAAVEGDVEVIEEYCQQLADGGHFLRRAGVEEWPDGTVVERYGFVHALYQQLWYERVTARRRQQWHRRIGERLEAAYADRTGKVAAELALHFEQGHDFRKAVQYRQHAATNATHRYAYKEAIEHLTAGLKLLKYERNPIERAHLELHLQTSLGAALVVTKGYSAAEVGKAYNRARKLCEQLRETPQVIPILFGLWQFYLLRGEFQTAQKLAEQLLARAEHTSDPAWLIRGYLALGVTCYYWGDLPTAREYLEKGSALSSHSHGRLGVSLQGSILIACFAYLAKTLWHLGYPDQALQRNAEMLSLVNAQSHPFRLAMALYHAACFHQLRRETSLTQEQARALLALSQEQGFGLYRAGGTTILSGLAQAGKSQQASGMEQEYQSLAAREVIGAEVSQPYFLAVLAETCGKIGRAPDGLTLLADALGAAQQKQTQIYTAELYRLTGELTLQQAGSRLEAEGLREKTKEAEECFLRAIAVARQQQAKSLELRAVMSLVRLLQQQATQDASRTTHHEIRAKLNEAHTMLAEVYNWFTEGFDTKDLHEAKGLLDELA